MYVCAPCRGGRGGAARGGAAAAAETPRPDRRPQSSEVTATARTGTGERGASAASPTVEVSRSLEPGVLGDRGTRHTAAEGCHGSVGGAQLHTAHLQYVLRCHLSRQFRGSSMNPNHSHDMLNT